MKKIIIPILICAMLVSILTGCDSKSEPAEKSAVCFVLGNTACSHGLNLSSQFIDNTLFETARNEGYVSVVNVDGNPEVVFNSSFELDERYRGASDAKLDMLARSNAASVTSILYSVIADDPESDYLESLRLAARSLSLEGYDSKTIVVVGTGLSTAGTLDFRNNLISAEPETIVEFLKEKKEIPDFGGITVYWQQLCDTAPPQAALSAMQRSNLEEIYKWIVETGGGKFVSDKISPNPVNKEAKYPEVTPVELPPDTPLFFEAEVLETVEEMPDIFIPEDKVAFIADKAEYVDPVAAGEVLRPIADFLAEHEATVLVCGCTAGDDNNEVAIDLSRRRAETVKRTLIDLGAEPTQIITIGFGCRDPWHISGVGYEGAAAAANRKVVIIDSRSDTAKDIIDGLE